MYFKRKRHDGLKRRLYFVLLSFEVLGRHDGIGPVVVFQHVPFDSQGGFGQGVGGMSSRVRFGVVGLVALRKGRQVEG